ncbi:MAG: Spx/MgsR family RNA polymerase-binding regulatory protein [Anaerococcus vaginalis]|nr:Spx/MgsR family RNA polymerase-binding regulatory protein [Anaerococcus vaginalis]
MKALLIGYKSCSTCKKTEKFLKEMKIEYKFQDVKEEKPEKDQIKEIYQKSGLDIKKFFNTSGQIYRKLNLKDKLKDMTEDEKLDLLASDGMLLKRPILVYGDDIVVGRLNIEKYFEKAE